MEREIRKLFYFEVICSFLWSVSKYQELKSSLKFCVKLYWPDNVMNIFVITWNLFEKAKENLAGRQIRQSADTNRRTISMQTCNNYHSN